MQQCRCVPYRSAASYWPRPPNRPPRRAEKHLCLPQPAADAEGASPDQASGGKACPPYELRMGADQWCERRQLRHNRAPSMALASNASAAAVPTAIWTQYSMIGPPRGSCLGRRLPNRQAKWKGPSCASCLPACPPPAPCHAAWRSPTKRRRRPPWPRSALATRHTPSR